MKAPLEYGDNFPVPTGSWNPAVPWRFPKHEIGAGHRGVWGLVLPWLTLGLGLALGILWMSWRGVLPLGVQGSSPGESLTETLGLGLDKMELPVPAAPAPPAGGAPVRKKPGRVMKSKLVSLACRSS